MAFIVFMHFLGEIKMKLNLLFFVMDMLTLLAYPIVYLHSKVYRFFRDKRKHHPERKYKHAKEKRLYFLRSIKRADKLS